jgi:hypothetical protein
MPISLSGSLNLSGSLTTTGTITATTLVVQTITSSISSITGSTNFGSLVTDTHKFTGSLNVTGALYVATGSVGIGTVSPSQLFEVVGGEIKAGRVDSSNEGGQISFGRSTDNATAWYIDAYGNVASPQLRFVNVSNAVVAMTITGSNVGIGTSTPITPLSLVLSTTNSQISTGCLEIQSYALNNSWVGDNVYFNGSAFKARNTGYVSQMYFNTDGAIDFYTYDGTITAGATVTLSQRMRITRDGHLKLLSTSAGGTNLDMYLLENDGLYLNANEGATGRNIYLQTGGTSRVRLSDGGTLYYFALAGLGTRILNINNL